MVHSFNAIIIYAVLLFFQGVDETVNSKTITEFYQWENEGFMPPASKPEQEFLDHGMFVSMSRFISEKNCKPKMK